jgi:xanthine dehydrogenase accessory factor
MKNIYKSYLEVQHSGQPLVLATVVRTQGSTPQKPGSTALIGADGIIAGTVGGGVSEGRVQAAAMAIAKSGRPALMEFNLANEISEKQEAICGGYATILLDADPVSSTPCFEELLRSIRSGKAGVLVTSLRAGQTDSISVDRLWIEVSDGIQGHIRDELKPEILRLVSSGDIYGFAEFNIHSDAEEPSLSYFLQPFFPPEKLVIAGAGHIGRALAHLGSLLDFEITVADDRAEYASKENIPDADHLVVGDIGTAMENLAVGEKTYVVIVTRGHKDDALALKPCIGRKLAYTGMIGSNMKVAAMRDDFLANGWVTEEQWSLIHSPVGLPIGSQSVEEIAVSIAAELVLVRNKRKKRN